MSCPGSKYQGARSIIHRFQLQKKAALFPEIRDLNQNKRQPRFNPKAAGSTVICFPYNNNSGFQRAFPRLCSCHHNGPTWHLYGLGTHEEFHLIMVRTICPYSQPWLESFPLLLEPRERLTSLTAAPMGPTGIVTTDQGLGAAASIHTQHRGWGLPSGEPAHPPNPRKQPVGQRTE